MTEQNKRLDLEQIQKKVDDWISQFDTGYWPPLSNLARLMEEVGELSREMNDIFGDKPKKERDSSTPNDYLAEEIADILFVIVVLANSLDIDLSEAFARVLEKYQIRDKDRFD